MARTPHFNFATFNASDRNFEEASWKFFDADRHTMDTLLWAVLNHRHNGTGSDFPELLPPNLAIEEALGGGLPAGTRLYYKYTLVDANGIESTPSVESYIDTPSPVNNPAAPAGITFANTGGTLLPGPYFYRLSSYVGENTVETRQSDPAQITVPAGSTTNQISFNLPSLPAGADGWNIYRRKPGGDYAYLTSLPSSATDFTDDGSIEDDCVRFPPTTNGTGRDNAVVVTFPGATPVVPEGFTWRLYRTTTPAIWTQSLVAHVVEETSEGSGIITPEFIDMGGQSGFGEPPEVGVAIPGFAKIDLTDGVEVDGWLPLANVSALPEIVWFDWGFEEPETAEVHPSTWVATFYGRVLLTRLVLASGAAPAVDDVIVDIQKGTGVTPSYATIFTDPGDQPTIPVGDQIGSYAYPDPVESFITPGDSLIAVCDQHGGGATRTDRGLRVQLLIFSYDFNATVGVTSSFSFQE